MQGTGLNVWSSLIREKDELMQVTSKLKYSVFMRIVAFNSVLIQLRSKLNGNTGSIRPIGTITGRC